MLADRALRGTGQETRPTLSNVIENQTKGRLAYGTRAKQPDEIGKLSKCEIDRARGVGAGMLADHALRRKGLKTPSYAIKRDRESNEGTPCLREPRKIRKMRKRSRQYTGEKLCEMVE